MKGFVYILRSLRNDRFYIGSTMDIQRRIRQHQSGYVTATKYILPVRLEFHQEYNDIELARKIERRLKSLKRRDFIEKILKDRIIKMTI